MRSRSRMEAIAPLHSWLKQGGANPPASRGIDAPPLLHLSKQFAFAGDEGNLKLVATERVSAGHFIIGVAKSSCLHVRSPAVAPLRRALVEKAADALRSAISFKTPLINRDDPGRLECIVLLTLELLDGDSSAWAPYLDTLPDEAFASTPSLWAAQLGEASAAALLDSTSIGSLVKRDQRDLASMCLAPVVASEQGSGDADAAAGDATADGLRLAALLGVSPAVSEAEARATFLRAIGLVATRLISGAGLVPLFDLLNGTVTGEHNATIEMSNLAATATAKDEAPCVAALASCTIMPGEEVLLTYGRLSSAQFLYHYGWLPGGDATPAPAISEHDQPVVVPYQLWPSLRDTQRAVLSKFGMTPERLGLDTHAPTEGLFKLPIQQAAEGKTPPPMRQVGLVAACTDEAVLAAIAETGKMGDHGVAPSEIGACAARWVREHAMQLCAEPGQAKTSAQRLATRLRRGERDRLVLWHGALAAKFGLPATNSAELDEACKAANTAVKKAFKAALKAAAKAQPQ